MTESRQTPTKLRGSRSPSPTFPREGPAMTHVNSVLSTVRHPSSEIHNSEQPLTGTCYTFTIKVMDTGKGLTEDEATSLFKPFHQVDSSITRNYGGTGLGLHISKELALLLGGDVEVDMARTAKNIGACFVFNCAFPGCLPVDDGSSCTSPVHALQMSGRSYPTQLASTTNINLPLSPTSANNRVSPINPHSGPSHTYTPDLTRTTQPECGPGQPHASQCSSCHAPPMTIAPMSNNSNVNVTEKNGENGATQSRPCSTSTSHTSSSPPPTTPSLYSLQLQCADTNNVTCSQHQTTLHNGEICTLPHTPTHAPTTTSETAVAGNGPLQNAASTNTTPKSTSTHSTITLGQGGNTLQLSAPLPLSNSLNYQGVPQRPFEVEPTGQHYTGGSNAAPPSSRRILIVEDNHLNFQVLQHALRKIGFTNITHAENGAEALCKCISVSFSAIMMDIQMPIIDGIRATQLIREGQFSVGPQILSQESSTNKTPNQVDAADFACTPSTVPIIGVTAHSFQREHDKMIEAGMDAVVTKPIQEKSLRRALAFMLEARDGAKAASLPLVGP
eukprot:TRINITY_DN67481_c5_g3_i1.p1 TRINITY_DN67481_c5_g3~~TRINITY_DN67481_c5_g3_i1.p1  ORF type:complete len:633 (+),score=12.76 TRINITY_DN67481_c5_g3_i1:223-1899(+)